MASWRGSTSPLAQDDQDELLNVVLPRAEQLLATHGEMLPFGAGMAVDGVAGIFAADPGLGARPPSQAVLGVPCTWRHARRAWADGRSRSSLT